MEFLSDSDKAKSLLRSGRGISKAFEEAGFTDKAAEVEVSGQTVLEAETGLQNFDLFLWKVWNSIASLPVNVPVDFLISWNEDTGQPCF